MNRLKSEPSKFFKIIRAIGLALAAVSGAVLAAPVVLPAGVLTAAGYIALAGTVAGAVAHTANSEE